MNIPAAMHIESAKDMPFDEMTQDHLLEEFKSAVPEASGSSQITAVIAGGMCAGYLLGLATARVMIAQGAWTQQNIIDDWSKAANQTKPAETPEKSTNEK